MRIIIRLFVDRHLLLVEQLDVLESELGGLLPFIAEKHALLIQRRHGEECHMIEFELPDEPVETRFFRFGTDQRAMRMPIAIDLNDN